MAGVAGAPAQEALLDTPLGWIDVTAIRDDVEALCAIERDSAGEGERASAQHLARRLQAIGAADVTIEPFRGQHTYAWAHCAHYAAGIAAARIGGAGGAALALGTLVSLELDVSAINQWLRRLLPAGEGANVVARIPAAGEAKRTLVLVAHHDAAHTGLVWHPKVVTAGAERNLRRKRVDAFMAPVGVALLLAATPVRALRAIGAAILGIALAAELDVGRSQTVPGASDNATGVAAVLALARALVASPLPDTEVRIALVGCEESGMEGMAAYVRAHRSSLDPDTTLVVSLDTLGAGTPVVAEAEGALREYRYRDADLAIADAGARAAGMPAPERWRIGGWTDPLVARNAGLPALSLLSQGPGYFPHYHHPSDTPENVDWDSVANCVRLAAGTLAAFGAGS